MNARIAKLVRAACPKSDDPVMAKSICRSVRRIYTRAPKFIRAGMRSELRDMKEAALNNAKEEAAEAAMLVKTSTS